MLYVPLCTKCAEEPTKSTTMALKRTPFQGNVWKIFKFFTQNILHHTRKSVDRKCEPKKNHRKRKDQHRDDFAQANARMYIYMYERMER